MLVLSRKLNEKIVIGGDVVITVTKISGNRITLGIEAPRSIPVIRGDFDTPNAETQRDSD